MNFFFVAGDSTGRLKRVAINSRLEVQTTVIETGMKEPIERILPLDGSLWIAVSCNGCIALVQDEIPRIIWKPLIRKGVVTGVELTKGTDQKRSYLMMTFSEDSSITVLQMNLDVEVAECQEHCKLDPYGKDGCLGISFLAQIADCEFCCGATGQELLAFGWTPEDRAVKNVFTSANVPESVVTGLLKDPGYLGCCLQDDVLWASCRNGQIRAFDWTTKQAEPLVAVKPFAKPYPLNLIRTDYVNPAQWNDEVVEERANDINSCLLIGDARGNCYRIAQLSRFLSKPKAPQMKKFRHTGAGSCISIEPLPHGQFLVGTMDGYVMLMNGTEEKLKIPIPRLTALSRAMLNVNAADELWDSLAHQQ